MVKSSVLLFKSWSQNQTYHCFSLGLQEGLYCRSVSCYFSFPDKVFANCLRSVWEKKIKMKYKVKNASATCPCGRLRCKSHVGAGSSSASGSSACKAVPPLRHYPGTMLTTGRGKKIHGLHYWKRRNWPARPFIPCQQSTLLPFALWGEPHEVSPILLPAVNGMDWEKLPDPFPHQRKPQQAACERSGLVLYHSSASQREEAN